MGEGHDVALLIGVDRAPGGNAYQHVGRELAWLRAGLTSVGCADVSVLDSDVTGAAALAAIRSFAKKLSDDRRLRGYLAFVGPGGVDAAGLYFGTHATVLTDAGVTNVLRLADVRAVLNDVVPQRAVTFRRGGSFTGVGAPAGSRVRTWTPAGDVGSNTVLRPFDRAVGPPVGGYVLDVDPAPGWDGQSSDVGSPFGTAVEIWVGTTAYKYYGVEAIPSYTSLGTVVITGTGFDVATTDLYAGAEHWAWTGAPFADSFRLVPDPTHALTLLGSYVRFAQQAFPTTLTPMPDVSTAAPAQSTYTWFQLWRGVAGATAKIRVNLRVTFTGGVVTRTDWWAAGTSLNSGGFLLVGSNEVLEFKKITANDQLVAGVNYRSVAAPVL